MKEPYGTTVFCDDIRDEVGGKRTYVGVYNHELIIDVDFPTILPTFGFAITYLELLSDPVEPVQIKILIPGDDDEPEVLGAIDLPADRPTSPSSDMPDPQAEYRAALLPVKVGPLVLKKPGYLKVRAYKGEKEIRLGALRVRSLPSEDLSESDS